MCAQYGYINVYRVYAYACGSNLTYNVYWYVGKWIWEGFLGGLGAAYLHKCLLCLLCVFMHVCIHYILSSSSICVWAISGCLYMFLSACECKRGRCEAAVTHLQSKLNHRKQQLHEPPTAEKKIKIKRIHHIFARLIYSIWHLTHLSVFPL